MVVLYPSALFAQKIGDNCAGAFRLIPCDKGAGCYAEANGDTSCRPYKAIGATCITNDHCASGVCAGTSCARSESLGAPCDHASSCGWENRCDLLGSKTCEKRFKLGEKCIMRNHECERGLRCLDQHKPGFYSAAVELNGVCTSPLALGAACRFDSQCSEKATCTDAGCTLRVVEGEECEAKAVRLGSGVTFFSTNCEGSLKCSRERVSQAKGVCSRLESAGTVAPLKTTVGTRGRESAPGASTDTAAKGSGDGTKDSDSEKGGLNTDSIVGLAVGIPGLVLTAVALYIAYASRRDSLTRLLHAEAPGN